MLICSKKRFGFRNSDGERFTTAGGLQFETAPDWITKDELYAAAVADGDIVECKGSSAAEETKVIAKATKKKAEPIQK